MSTGAGTARLDRRTGKRLLEHVRAIVRAAARDEPLPPAPDLPVLAERRGVFVTLKRDGTLRGCIGRPYPEQPLAEGLEVAASGAATSDPRFPPLDPDELASVTVSLSVLTPPEPVPDPGPDAVEIGRDGLIVSKDGRSGLLLPQVAVEQDFSALEFLRETARKAGLPAAAWQADETTVKRFSSQVFAETAPGGPITVEEYIRGPNDRSTD